MNGLLQDLRYGLRQLRKNPGFTAVAVITLALGIGASTAMFSVINSVLLRSLPFPNPSRLMAVSKTMSNGTPNAFSTPAFLEWREQGGLTGHMGAFSAVGKNLAGKQLPELVSGGRMNYDLQHNLGIQPSGGRFFTPQEDTSGSAPVVLLSHSLWVTRFESKPMLGRAIDLDGNPYTVVGIMPPRFHVLSDQEQFWIPLQLESVNAQSSARNIHWLFAFVRLPDGMSQKQVVAQMAMIAARFKKQDPKGEGAMGVRLQTIAEFQYGNIKPALLLLMGAVGFVLLIACSNVANLLLARRVVRQREMSIRSALGAVRMRLVRQLLTESIVLSLTGGLLGLAFAWAAIRVLVAVHPSSIPSVQTIGIDTTVLAYTALTCIVVAILFGIAPAWEGSKSNVSQDLKQGLRGSSGSFGKERVVLVVSETALASILLIGAGLSLRSLWRTENVALGFDPSNVLTFRLTAPPQYTGAGIPLFYRQVLERIKALPGVQSAVLARNLPMSGVDPSMAISIEGAAPPPSQLAIVTRLRAIGPDYFAGLEIPLLSGREINDHDTATSPRVALVSQSLAKLYWPNQDAIGKRLKPEMPGGEWCTVVGVVADVHHWAADVTIEPTAYYPYTQIPESYLSLVEGNMSVAVRAQSSSGLSDSIRAAVGEVNKSVPIFLVQSMDQMVADSGSLRRFDMWLIGTFAGLALILAAVGIYGVMAYSVSQRTREIGIRIALGAHPGMVLQLIMSEGAKLALAGVVSGLLGAMALTRLMASLLFGVSPRDWATFSVVPWIVFLMILAGCYIPARRAAKVDPIAALRYE